MIEIDGKVYRNIQEQVGKNQDDIEDLDERVEALENRPIPTADAYTKAESDAKFQTIAGMSTYAKLNDDTQTITASALTVTPGGGYIHTTYGPTTISMSIPRTPGYTLTIPTKDGTLATIGDIPTYAELYHHNYCGVFRCIFNSDGYFGTFALDCVSSSNGSGTTLTDLKNMLNERGYYNTTITSDVPSSDIIQMYGLRTTLSLRQGSVNPGYQYPASMFLHKDNIYITINTNDNEIGNGKVFKVVEQAFSMRHLVTQI